MSDTKVMLIAMIKISVKNYKGFIEVTVTIATIV